MKKRITLITLIGLFLLMLPLMARAEIVDSGTCGDNLTWSLTDEGILTISGNGNMNGFTTGNQPWKNYRTSIVSVNIENGVSSIGSYAFYNCKNMISVTIPQSVTCIGAEAFYSCYAINEIHISSIESWLSIDFGPNGSGPNESSSSVRLYIENEEIINIALPESVTSIGTAAFMNCTRLSSITIPESVTSIGTCAFYNCTGLSSITLPESMTSIGASAFYNCTALSSITLPEGMTNIGWCTFENCKSLITITMKW